MSQLSIISEHLLAVLLVASPSFNSAQAADTKESNQVIYTANAGVMLKTPNGNILLDSVFDYHPEWENFDYAHFDQKQKLNIENGSEHFSNTKLVLATHVHRDHFHPEMVGKMLATNPKTELFANGQITESVLEGYINSVSLMKQIKTATQSSAHWKDENTQITIYPFPHANRVYEWIDNSLILADIEGTKYLHIGDASPNKQEFEKLALAERKIDVLFAPYWFLRGPGEAIIKQLIKPKKVIALHIPPSTDMQQRIKQALQPAYSNIEFAVDNMTKVKP